MKHCILFTGHMIDAPDRKEPRFPDSKEQAVKEEIYKLLVAQKEKAGLPLNGIASGACGSDILFHELCASLNIPSEVYLAAPVETFKQKSVSFAGESWEARYDQLLASVPVHILPDDKGDAGNMNIYERTNEWMLETALANGGPNMTLIAVWNGSGGDGKGGTEHMVKMAKEKGAEAKIIEITKL